MPPPVQPQDHRQHQGFDQDQPRYLLRLVLSLEEDKVVKDEVVPGDMRRSPCKFR